MIKSFGIEAGFQCRQADNSFEYRTWSITALGSPIEHGLKRFILDPLVFAWRKTVDEIVRVEAGDRSQRENVAGPDIHHNSCGHGLWTKLPQGLFGCFLDAEV